MKYIDKEQEPPELKEYRENTPEASYNGFQGRTQVREALLREQGCICAYCMRRISLKWDKQLKKPRTEIEHYQSQELRSDKQLDYQNMLGVCNGVSGVHKHCDKTTGGKGDGKVILKKLNPLDQECERLLTYNANGEVQSIFDEEEVREEIERILNLNNQNLKEYRKTALDKFWEDFKKRNASKSAWTKELFEKEIKELQKKDKKGKYKPYCQFLIWYLEIQKKKNKYR